MADVITLQEALALGNNGNTSSTPTSTTSQKSTAPTADVTQNTSNSSRNVITLQEALALGNGGATPTTQTSSETNSKKSASEYYAGTNYSASPSKQYANAAYGAVTEALSKPSNAYLANLVKENPNYVANTLYQQWLSSNATADTATKNATRSAYFSAAQQYQAEHSTAPSASQSTVAYDSNGNVDATGTLLNVINDAKAINNAANAAKPTGNTKGSEDYDAAVLNVYKHLGGKTLLGKVLNENLYQQATEIVNDSGFWKDNTKQTILPSRFGNLTANSIMARAEAKAGNATSNLYGSRAGKNYLDYYNNYADKSYASKLLSNVGNTVFNYANNVVNFELTGLNAVTGGKIQNSSVFNIANFLQNATSGVSGLKSSALRDNTSFIGRLILDLEQTTIEQGLDRAFAAITGIPSASLGMMGVRVFGAGAQEAEDAGKGIDQQVLSGVVQAGIEVATELAGGVGGSWRGRGYIDSVFDVLDDFVSTKTGSELVGTLVRAFGSEAVEEMTSDVLNPIVSWALGMSDDVTDFKSLLVAIWGNGNLLYDGLLGGLAGMFGGAQVSLQQSRASRQIGVDVAIYKAAQSIVEDKKLRAKFEIKTGIELSSDNEAATAQVAAAIANDIVDGETTAREVRDAITSYGAIGSSEGYNNIFGNILANMGGAETAGADTFAKQGQKPKQKPKQKQTLTPEQRAQAKQHAGTLTMQQAEYDGKLQKNEEAIRKIDEERAKYQPKSENAVQQPTGKYGTNVSQEVERQLDNIDELARKYRAARQAWQESDKDEGDVLKKAKNQARDDLLAAIKNYSPEAYERLTYEEEDEDSWEPSLFSRWSTGQYDTIVEFTRLQGYAPTKVAPASEESNPLYDAATEKQHDEDAKKRLGELDEQRKALMDERTQLEAERTRIAEELSKYEEPIEEEGVEEEDKEQENGEVKPPVKEAEQPSAPVPKSASERERSEYAKGTYGNSKSDLSAELALSEYARSVKNDDGLTWEEYLLDSRADINADVLYKRWKLGVTEPTIAEAEKGKAYSLEAQVDETGAEIAKVQNTRHERFDVLPDEAQAQIKEIVRLANSYISSAQNAKRHYQGAEGSFVNTKSLEEDRNKLREAVKNYSSQAYDEAFHLEPNGEFAIDRAISEGKVESGREFADWARLVYKTSIDVTKATKIQEEQESKLAKLHEQREGLLKEIAERDTKSKVQAEAEKKAKAKKETMAQEKPKKSGVDLLVEEATKKPTEAKKSEDGKTTPPKQQEAKKAASEELNKQESENKPKTGADYLAEAASKPVQEEEKAEPVEAKPDSVSKFTKESFKALLARNGFSKQQRNDIAPTLFRILNGEKITLSEVEKMLDDDGALSSKFKTILEKYLDVDFSPYTFFEGAEYVNRNEALEALNDKAAENDAKAQGKEYKPRTREEVQEAHDAEMEPLKEAGAWEPWEPSEREKKIIDAWSGRTKKAKPLGAPEKGTKWPEKYTRIRRRLYGMAFRASIDANTGDAEIDAQLETLNKEIDYLSAKVADEKTVEAAARSLERTIKSARNAATEQSTEDAEAKVKAAEEKKAARTAKQISELEAHSAEIESSLSEHKEQLENAKEAFEEAEREYNEAYEKWFNSSYTNIKGKGYVRKNAKFTHNYEFYHLDELKDARDAREYDCSKLERQIKEETRQLAYANERLNGLKNPTTQKSKSTSTEPKAEAKSEPAAATEVETDVDYKSELSKLEKQRKDIIAKVADKLYSNYAKRAAEKLFEYSNKKIGRKVDEVLGKTKPKTRRAPIINELRKLGFGKDILLDDRTEKVADCFARVMDGEHITEADAKLLKDRPLVTKAIVKVLNVELPALVTEKDGLSVEGVTEILNAKADEYAAKNDAKAKRLAGTDLDNLSYLDRAKIFAEEKFDYDKYVDDLRSDDQLYDLISQAIQKDANEASSESYYAWVDKLEEDKGSLSWERNGKKENEAEVESVDRDKFDKDNERWLDRTQGGDPLYEGRLSNAALYDDAKLIWRTRQDPNRKPNFGQRLFNRYEDELAYNGARETVVDEENYHKAQYAVRQKGKLASMKGEDNAYTNRNYNENKGYKLTQREPPPDARNYRKKQEDYDKIGGAYYREHKPTDYSVKGKANEQRSRFNLRVADNPDTIGTRGLTWEEYQKDAVIENKADAERLRKNWEKGIPHGSNPYREGTKSYENYEQMRKNSSSTLTKEIAAELKPGDKLWDGPRGREVTFVARDYNRTSGETTIKAMHEGITYDYKYSELQTLEQHDIAPLKRSADYLAENVTEKPKAKKPGRRNARTAPKSFDGQSGTHYTKGQAQAMAEIPDEVLAKARSSYGMVAPSELGLTEEEAQKLIDAKLGKVMPIRTTEAEKHRLPRLTSEQEAKVTEIQTKLKTADGITEAIRNSFGRALGGGIKLSEVIQSYKDIYGYNDKKAMETFITDVIAGVNRSDVPMNITALQYIVDQAVKLSENPNADFGVRRIEGDPKRAYEYGAEYEALMQVGNELKWAKDINLKSTPRPTTKRVEKIVGAPYIPLDVFNDELQRRANAEVKQAETPEQIESRKSNVKITGLEALVSTVQRGADNVRKAKGQATDSVDSRRSNSEGVEGASAQLGDVRDADRGHRQDGEHRTNGGAERRLLDRLLSESDEERRNRHNRLADIKNRVYASKKKGTLRFPEYAELWENSESQTLKDALGLEEDYNARVILIPESQYTQELIDLEKTVQERNVGSPIKVLFVNGDFEGLTVSRLKMGRIIVVNVEGKFAPATIAMHELGHLQFKILSNALNLMRIKAILERTLGNSKLNSVLSYYSKVSHPGISKGKATVEFLCDLYAGFNRTGVKFDGRSMMQIVTFAVETAAEFQNSLDAPFTEGETFEGRFESFMQETAKGKNVSRTDALNALVNDAAAKNADFNEAPTPTDKDAPPEEEVYSFGSTGKAIEQKDVDDARRMYIAGESISNIYAKTGLAVSDKGDVYDPRDLQIYDNMYNSLASYKQVTSQRNANTQPDPMVLWQDAEAFYGRKNHQRLYDVAKRINDSELFMETKEFEKNHVRGNSEAKKIRDSVKEFKGALEKLGSGELGAKEFYEYYKGIKGDSVLGDFYDERIAQELEAATDGNVNVDAVPKIIEELARHIERTGEAWNTLDGLNKAAFANGVAPTLTGEKSTVGEKVKSFAQTAANKFAMLQIQPAQFFRRIDGWKRNDKGVGYKIADQIQGSAATKQKIIVQAQGFFKDVMKDVKAYNAFATGKTMSGVKLKFVQDAKSGRSLPTKTSVTRELSVRDAVSLYLSLDSLSGEALDALEGFGLSDGNKAPMLFRLVPHADSNGVHDEHNVFNLYAELKRAVDNDPTAQAYMDAFHKMAEFIKPYAKSTSQDVLGTDIFMMDADKYYPVARYDPTNAQKDAKDNFGIADIKYMHNRSESAEGFIAVRDAVTTTQNYIESMANYIAYADIADTLKRMKGLKSFYVQDFIKTIRSNFGDDMGAWLENYINDINDMSAHRAQGNFRLTNWLTRNFQTAVLIGNIGTPLKQQGTLWNSMAELDSRAVLKAAVTSLAPGNKIIKNAKSNNILLQYRGMGNIDATIADALNDEKTIFGRLTAKSKLLQKVASWIPKADIAEVSKVYLASYYDVILKNPSINQSSARFQRLVDQTFERALFSSQAQYDMNLRDEIARGDNDLLKLVNMFQTQQRTVANQLWEALGEQRADPKSAEAKAKLQGAVTGWVASCVATGIMSTLGQLIRHKLWGLRDDDDKEKLSWLSILQRIGYETLEALAGTAMYGEDIAAALLTVITKGDESYYASDVPTVSMFTDILTSITDLASSDGTAIQNADAIRKLGGEVANLFGIPLNNAYTSLNAMLMWSCDIVNALKRNEDKSIVGFFTELSKGSSIRDFTTEDRADFFKMSDDPVDDILKTLAKLDKAVLSFAGTVSIDDGEGNKITLTLTNDERRQYAETAKETYDDAVSRLLSNGTYKLLDDESKENVLEQVEEYSRGVAREEIAHGQGYDWDYEPYDDLQAQNNVLDYYVLNEAISEDNYSAVDYLLKNYTSISKAVVDKAKSNTNLHYKDMLYASLLGIKSEEWDKTYEAVKAATTKNDTDNAKAMATYDYLAGRGFSDDYIFTAIKTMVKPESGGETAAVVRRIEAYNNTIAEKNGTADLGSFLELIALATDYSQETQGNATLSKDEMKHVWYEKGLSDRDTYAGLTFSDFYAICMTGGKARAANEKYATQNDEIYASIDPAEEKEYNPLIDILY